MTQGNAPKIRDDSHHEISVLAVITPKCAVEVKRILSHTRWQTQVVTSFQEAAQILRLCPISVILCEDRLSDGTWLDILRETHQLCPRPQTIVLSQHADATFWGEVLNCGGYDLLPIPLDAHEVYAIIPMAWRHFVGTGERSTHTAEAKLAPELAKVS